MNKSKFETLYKVINCDFLKNNCETCPYGYQYFFKDSYPPYWGCDEERIKKEIGETFQKEIK